LNLNSSGLVPDFDNGRGHVVTRHDQRGSCPQEHCQLHDRQDRHRHRPQVEHHQERGQGKHFNGTPVSKNR